jgi:hypothetical protein
MTCQEGRGCWDDDRCGQLPAGIPEARDIALGIVGQHVLVATAVELRLFDTTVGPNTPQPTPPGERPHRAYLPALARYWSQRCP